MAGLSLVAYGSTLVRRGRLSAGNLASISLTSAMIAAGLAGFARISLSDWQSPAWRALRYHEKDDALKLQQEAHFSPTTLSRASEKVATLLPSEPGAHAPASSTAVVDAKTCSGADHKASQSLSGNVRFQGVKFRYKGRQDAAVLDGVDLDIKAGQILGITGPSGSGKTTLANLLLGLYSPDEGEIYLDGKELDMVKAAALRGQVGVVDQNATLFSGTLMDNIRYGNLDATDEDVECAARAANAHDFIERFPKGYKTVVGPRGARTGLLSSFFCARIICHDSTHLRCRSRHTTDSRGWVSRRH